MALRFAYTRADGGLSIVNAAPKEQLERVLGPLTDAAYEKHVEERSRPVDAIDWVRLPDDWAPPDKDRTFRNAWTQSPGQSIVVDLPKARDIHSERLRELRAPRLAALDTDYMRALERSDAQAMQQIAMKKQALRDVTVDPAIEAAQTPDELRAVMPAALRP